MVIRINLLSSNCIAFSPQTQTIGNASQQIVSNTYDELGQLKAKSVGAGLQKVDYTYNIRGWLKTINNDTDANDNDLFNFKIGYNEGANPLYNGNIATTQWQTASINSTTNPVSTTYTYNYDALNRITSGIDNTTNYNLNTVEYDKNGNITHLNRNGHTNEQATQFGVMDNLAYTYQPNSNKLLKVDENEVLAKNVGFKETTNGNDYTYDANGNMLTDANKGIINISYNHLNLPTQVTFAEDKYITYFYDASGGKLSKIVTQTGNTTTTKYAGNYIYEEAGGVEELKFFNVPEGYVEPEDPSNYTAGFNYIYQYKDHLGNIRLSYSDSDNNGIIATSEIIEENNYYPFGLKHKGYNNVVSPNSNSIAKKFKYNGKELEEGLGYNMYEYEARHYDAALGRFVTVDPLAEDYNFQSPYAYAVNNPVFFIDKLGMGADWERNVDKKTGTITYTAQKGDSAYSLHQQYGEQDGFTAEEAIDIVEAGVGRKNYRRESDNMLMSNVEVGDTVTIPNSSTNDSNNDNAISGEVETIDNASQSSDILGKGNAVAAVTASALANTPGSFRVTTTKQGLSPKYYGNSWTGNQYAKTFNIGKIGRLAGYGGFGAGLLIDAHNVSTNQTSVEKAGLNTAIGAYGLTGPGTPASVMYFSLEAFYPGGAGGALNDNMQSQAIFRSQNNGAVLKPGL